jgi:hypothetical protein
MRPLASLERFFERLFEGQSARLFHTKLQPIQLQRRVERAMESGRGARRRPHLRAAPVRRPPQRRRPRRAPGGPSDARRGPRRRCPRVRPSHHYRLADRPTVALVADVAIEAGDVLVAAAAEVEHADDASRGGADRATDPAGEQTAVFVVPTVDAPRARLREVPA